MSTNEFSRPRDRHAFQIAIFCALGLEADAMIALFDDIWEQNEQYEKSAGDTNSYTIGRIGQHHVVLAHLPRMGKVSASTVAANVRSSFPSVRLGLLVGICGAVPLAPNKREILLGDVIISTHLIQSDYGRIYPQEFARKTMLQDNLGRPCPEIAGFLTRMQGKAAQNELKSQIQLNLDTIHRSPDLGLSTYPGFQEDKLFEASYRHKHQDTKACGTCADSSKDACQEALEMPCTELGCDFGNLVPRDRIRKMAETKPIPTSYCPELHFGGMASGDQVVKSGQHRDRIVEEEGIIAFEMEGAGIWDTIPAIVVKAACDYADSHKNKRWQLYAAATAAFCAKGMLAAWRKTETPPVQGRSRDEEPTRPPTQNQIFNGRFSAGKNIHNGGTYTAESISF